MAAQTTSLGRLTRLALWAALSCAAGAAQTALTLEQAGSRKGPDFAPAYEGETVAVQGVVSLRPIDRTYYRQIAIQDEAGYGLTLEGSPTSFGTVAPGDRIEARGTVSKRAGLPILMVASIEILAHGTPPAPLPVRLRGLLSFRYLGVLVETEARVLEVGENQGGEYLAVGDRAQPLQVFLPYKAHRETASLKRFDSGDRVRIVGLASQYCRIPPYDRYFQVVIGSSDAVTLLEKRWLITPRMFFGSLGALGLALLAWWARERRMAAQRRTVKALYALSEEILGAGSPEEILRTIGPLLPQHLGVSGVRLHLYHSATKSLERLEVASGGPRMTPVNPPGGWLSSAAAACFRNEALLAIPDTRRSPFFRGQSEPDRPRSAMYVPMLAHTELLGVLEIYDDRRTRSFRPDEQVMVQHLANQIALALRLMQEQTVREQLFRSERLAATGQLISGVVTELRTPLEKILALADASAERGRTAELEAIALEAERASEIAARLLSFTHSEPAEARPVDACALLHNLMEFRRSAWKARGLVVLEQICPGPLWVSGARAQLERVLLNVLVHAEQALAGAPEKKLSIGANALGKRVLLEVSFSAAVEAGEGEGTEPALPDESVCRSIIRSHGGEVRVTRTSEGSCRLEIELPAAAQAEPGFSSRAEEAVSARPLTVLVVEPDEAARRKLVALLSRRNCRAVPAAGAERAADMAGRLPFDLVFCPVRVFGVNWLEFFQRVRDRVGGFVLLTESYDAEIVRTLPAEEVHVITKPVTDQELERVLLEAASRVSRLAHAAAQRAVQ